MRGVAHGAVRHGGRCVTRVDGTRRYCRCFDLARGNPLRTVGCESRHLVVPRCAAAALIRAPRRRRVANVKDPGRGPGSSSCGRDRRRSGDLPLFRRSLCQLSYPTMETVSPSLPHRPVRQLAVPTGFEPATSGLTGRRALQTAPRDHELRTPNGIRTRVTCVKGRRPRPLDDGGSRAARARRP